MIILRKGDIEKILEPRYFLCPTCGCLWKANKDEYETDTQYNELYHTCKCPFESCKGIGKEISKEKAEEELQGMIGVFRGEEILQAPKGSWPVPYFIPYGTGTPYDRIEITC